MEEETRWKFLGFLKLFFIKIIFNRIAKLKKFADKELPPNQAQTSVEEFLS